MTPDDFRLCIENTKTPFLIRTQGGRSYPITDRAHIWMPPEYDNVACLVVRGQGVIMLRLSSIETLHLEHDIERVKS